MQQEDEEFEKLLGEIPHVTNGSAQAESSVSAGAKPAACAVRDQVPSMSMGNHNPPLMGSEVFGQFYPAFQVVDELQPNEEQSYLGARPSLIGSEDIPKLSLNGEETERQQLLIDQEEEVPLASLGFAESHSHQVPDVSLVSAFSKTTLKAESSPRHLMQSHDRIAVAINRGPRNSVGLQKHVELTQPVTASVDLRTGAGASTYSDKVKVFPRRPGLSGSCPNSHSVNGSLRQEIYEDGSSLDARRAHANGGTMFAYAAGIGSAPVRTMSDGMDYSGGYADALFMEDGTGAQHKVVSFPYCHDINSHANEIISPVYYGGRSLDQVHGPKRTVHNTETVDILQVPPSSLHSVQYHSQRAETPTSYAHMEQDVYWDLSIPSYCQSQKVHKMQLHWHRREEEREWMQKIFDYRSQALGCIQSPSPFHAQPCSAPSFHTAVDQPCRPLHMGPATNMTDWKLQFCPGDVTRFSSQDFVPPAEECCTSSAEGFCSRGETCPMYHAKSRNTLRSRAFKLAAASPCGKVTPLVSRDKQPSCPVKILSRESSTAAPTVFTLSCVDGNKETVNHTGDVFAKDLQSGHLLIGKQHFKELSMNPLEFDWPKEQLSMQGKFSSLEDIKGHIYSAAKDQHGCRFLQRQFDEGGPEEVEKIFSEIVDHVLELMVDPFGNYLVQKLLEVCNEVQRLKILSTTTANGELINVSLNMHGTRAVQKLIETLTSSQQVSMVTASLQPGVVTLIKDLNGNHVVQRCLQHLSSEDSQFIFEVVTSHCVEIATHRHGCCVLQRCIDYSKGVPHQRLIAEIAADSLLLSQDPFGNYVVQYVLDLGIPWVAIKVIEQLAGHFAHLSMQKFSSNVVEKCLKFAEEGQKNQLIQELMEDSHLLELLQDPYANYVIQSALSVSKGALHASLVDAICPHMPFLRSSPYGKRILSRRNLKKC